jgi:hypothetical protein
MTSGQASTTPSSVMKSRRFTLNVSRASDRKDSTTSVRQEVLHCGISIRPMTAVGQSRSWRHVRVESVLPPTSDIGRRRWYGSFVPTAEMHDRDQDAETVLAALRMTSRTTPGFDSMGT